MKKYRCKEPLVVDSYDEDGYRLYGQYITVPAGTVMKVSKELRLGAPPSVHLESKNGLWVEVSPETLKQHFEEVIS